MKFFDYVNERGGRVTLTAIDAPGIEWESPLAVFEAAYGHEVMVSERINNLAALAQRENDFATRNVLDWFIAEQVEEEASADAIVQRQTFGMGPLTSVGELFTDKTITEEQFKAFAERLTVRSSVFEIRSTGLAAIGTGGPLSGSGIRRDIVAIVDRGRSPVNILYWYQSE